MGRAAAHARPLAGEAEMKWIVSHHEFGEMAAVAIEMLDLSSWWRRRRR